MCCKFTIVIIMSYFESGLENYETISIWMYESTGTFRLYSYILFGVHGLQGLLKSHWHSLFQVTGKRIKLKKLQVS